MSRNHLQVLTSLFLLGPALPLAAQEPEEVPLPPRSGAVRKPMGKGGKPSPEKALPGRDLPREGRGGVGGEAGDRAAVDDLEDDEGLIPALPSGVAPRRGEGGAWKSPERPGSGDVFPPGRARSLSFLGRGPVLEDPGREPKQDLLERVLDQLGGEAAFRSLGALEIQRSLRALDRRRREIFKQEFRHRASLAKGPGNDEIQWSESLSFGRRNGRVWARSTGVDRPDLEAQVELEVRTWALLARFPFCFRDATRFRILPEEKASLLGSTWLRLSLLELGSAPGIQAGLGGEARKDTRYDLFLEPRTLLPRFLEIRRGGARRLVFLSDWQPLVKGGALLPRERTFMAEDRRTPSLEVVWTGVKQIDPRLLEEEGAGDLPDRRR